MQSSLNPKQQFSIGAKFQQHRQAQRSLLHELVPSELSQAWLDTTLGSIRYSWDLHALQDSVIRSHHDAIASYDNLPYAFFGSYFFVELCSDLDKEVTDPISQLLELTHIADLYLQFITLRTHAEAIPSYLQKKENFDILLNQMAFTRMIGYLLLHRPIPRLAMRQTNELYAVVMDQKLQAGLGRAHMLSWSNRDILPKSEQEYFQALQDMGMPSPLRAAAHLARVLRPYDTRSDHLVLFAEQVMVLWQLRSEFNRIFEGKFGPSHNLLPPSMTFAACLILESGEDAAAFFETSEEGGQIFYEKVRARLDLRERYLNAIDAHRTSALNHLEKSQFELSASLRETLEEIAQL